MCAYFKENPVDKVALAKRFRRGEDAFDNASGKRGRNKKKRKLSGKAAAKALSKVPDDSKTPTESEDDAVRPDVD